jgi:ubiquinone/menaquinone biosynthesis C-methylase UbiE
MVENTISGKIDLFGHDGQAGLYRDFRPRYPCRLVDSVISKVQPNSRELYVDVACGPGTLTEVIAPSFRRTIGIDQSFEQLSKAKVVEGCDMEYVPASAFEIPCQSSSVDLVTVGQGLHWLLPYSDFFNEVFRVLKPGGVFAAVAYGFPSLENPSANVAVRRFYCEVLGATLHPGDPGCWWETDRPTIDSFYHDIPFPRDIKREHFPERVSMTVNAYMNYLKTLSAYRTLLRSGVEDPLLKLEDEIRFALCVSPDAEGNVVLEIPFFTVSFIC